MPERHNREAPDTEADLDWQILDLLLDHDNPRPWSIQEVIHAHGNEQRALDGLEHLRGDGLIHRTADGFVFPTRAAVRLSQLGS